MNSVSSENGNEKKLKNLRKRNQVESNHSQFEDYANLNLSVIYKGEKKRQKIEKIILIQPSQIGSH